MARGRAPALTGRATALGRGATSVAGSPVSPVQAAMLPRVPLGGARGDEARSPRSPVGQQLLGEAQRGGGVASRPRSRRRCCHGWRGCRSGRGRGLRSWSGSSCWNWIWHRRQRHRFPGPVCELGPAGERRFITAAHYFGDHRHPLPPSLEVRPGHGTDPSLQPIGDLTGPPRPMRMERLM